MLQSKHALIGQQVRQALLKSRWLEGAVEIDHQLVLGTLADDALIVVDHPLVTVIHEVNLQTHYAHFGIIGYQVHVMLDGEP